MVRTYLVVLVAVAGANCWACGGYGGDFSPPSIEQLREQGPAGLKRALKAYDIERMGIKKPNPKELERLRKIVDQVAAQRHATISRLYWHTDLEKAKAAAAESGKPILSLRMLGKLTDELSCANSRFFRTALYANEEISKVMRENFVLHWQSVRPVPKVTIDFGDGRVLERTVTGNSAHYVLDAEGRPLDVLPGLYSPKEFRSWLERTVLLAEKYAEASSPEYEGRISAQELLQIHHVQRQHAILVAWQSDIQQAGLESAMLPIVIPGGKNSTVGKFPAANRAAQVAVAKGRAEAPLLTAIGQGPLEVESRMNDKDWRKIASLHRSDTKLDKQTVKLMRQENPNAFQAGALAPTKRFVEDPILRLVRSFEDSIALDTVRNEYLLHRQIHQWFIDGGANTDVDTLNERVYAELFLTPSSDPWLGLVPADSYTALNGGGLSDSRRNREETTIGGYGSGYGGEFGGEFGGKYGGGF